MTLDLWLDGIYTWLLYPQPLLIAHTTGCNVYQGEINQTKYEYLMTTSCRKSKEDLERIIAVRVKHQ